MKNMKWWMGWLAAVTLVGTALAEEISLEQAETAAGNWIARGGAFGLLEGGAELAGETMADSETGIRWHVVKAGEKGIVVMSADDRIEPVLAFVSVEGGKVPGLDHPFWALVKADIAARSQAADEDAPGQDNRRGMAKDGAKIARQKWGALLGNGAGGRQTRAAGVSSLGDVRVEPLLETKWGQGAAGGGACWNYYTPNQYPCGCNATALAQIMRYWKKPSGSVSAKSYTCKVDGTSKSMTMKGGTYNWGQMPANPSSGGATAAQREAMGKLAYDAAVSLATIWTTYEGASCLLEMMPALKEDYGYSSAVALEYVSGYYAWSLEEFKKAVIPNLDKKCPVALELAGNGYHTALADGYGYSGGSFYIHVNFGWEGSGDAWYCPPSVSDYSSIFRVLCNVFPSETGNILSGRVTDSRGVPVSGATVRLSEQSGVSVGTTTTDSRGIYSFTTTKKGSFSVTATFGGQSVSRSGTLGNTTTVNLDPVRSGTGYHYPRTCAIGNTYGNDLQFGGAVSGTSTVTLDAGGGTGGTASVTATYGSSMPAVAVPAREGYLFGGYWTGPDGTGLQWYTSSGTGVRTWDQAGAVTLYAKWTYTGDMGGALDNTVLSFETDGPFPWQSQAYDTHDGTDALRCAAIGAGGTNWQWSYSVVRTTLRGPGRLSFWWKAVQVAGGNLTFTGGDFYKDTLDRNWTRCSLDFTEDTARGVEWSLGCNGVYSITGCLDQVTWTPGYAVKLDGGSLWQRPTTVLGVPGEPLPDISVAANYAYYSAYYQFAGFFSGANGTGIQYYNSAGKGVRNWDISCNAILYAKWDPATYAITLDRQGGGGGDTGTTATYSSNLPAIAVPSRDGYDFIGYFSEPAGEGTQYYNADGRGCQNWYMIDHTTLYAYWIRRMPIQWGYQLDNGRAIVTNAVPSAGWLEIPSELDGYPVIGIGGSAFEQCDSLVGISIPEGVTKIMASAFSSCRHLVSVSLPSTLTTIGPGAFWACDGVASVTIPDRVREIPAGAFACRDLTSVSIGSGVTEIGERAFAFTRLTSVDIPDQVASIDPWAFYQSTELTEIRVSASNSHYASEGGVLFSKDKRTLVCMPGGKTGHYDVPSGVETIGPRAFEWSPLTGITLPDTLVQISDHAFELCRLEEISIPDSVSLIGKHAFDSATRLVSVWLGRGVREIGDGAFEDCWNLEWFQVAAENPAYESDGGVLFSQGKREIVRVPPAKAGRYVVPDGVERVGNYAFDSCGALTEVVLPGSVTSIGDYAFDGCKGLFALAIPESVTELGRGAFQSCAGLRTIVIPDGVQGIGSSTFAYCTNLVSVILPDSVMDIGYDAFFSCDNLTSLRLPPYVTNVSYQVFSGCGALATLQVPEEWEGTDMLAWAKVPAGCTVETYPTQMQRVVFDANGGECAVPFEDFARGGTYGEFPVPVFENHLFLGWFTATNGNSEVSPGMAVTEPLVRCLHAHWSQPIGTIHFDRQGGTGGTESVRAMYGEILQPVEIPVRPGFDFGGYYTGEGGSGDRYYDAAGNGIRWLELGDDTTLYALWYEQTDVAWGYRIENGKAIVTNAVPAQGRLVIPANLGGCPVAEVGSWAFANATNLTEIVISASVTNIGNRAFYECRELTSVTIPASVTHIGYQAFEYCSRLATVTLPSSMTEIDASTFSWCGSLASVVIPDSVSRIQSQAFEHCGLVTVAIPASVTNMGDSVFASCSALEQIQVAGDNPCFSSENGILFSKDKTSLICFPGGKGGHYDIPAYVTNMWRCAFEGCRGLTSVTIPESLKSICFGAFRSCTGLAAIEIPEGVTTIEPCAFQYCNGLSSVTMPDTVTNIGYMAFDYCRELATLEISSNVTSIGSSAFTGCEKLTTLALPSSVTNIGNQAFSSCYKLASVTIPSSVTSIGNGLFSNCYGLTMVAIPNSVTNIGSSAFSYCWRLESFVIPDSVVAFGTDVFAHCVGLQRLEVPGAWWGTDRVAQLGIPPSCEVTYRGIEPLTVVTDELPAGIVGEAYEVALEASGGVGGRAWREGEGVYLEMEAAGSYAETGTAQGWRADDDCWDLALPFAFPFCGHSYTNAKVNSNGTISFGKEGIVAGYFTSLTFCGTPMIAALWEDLTTEDGDIYVETASGWVKVQWRGEYYEGGDVNFSATLHEDGRIVLSYGAGNTLGGTIGISSGDGATALLSAKSGNGNMANAQDIVFHPGEGMPGWLELTPDGILRGTPEADGEYTFVIAVEDSAGVVSQQGMVLTVHPLVSQTVTFDANGGTCGTATMTYGIGEVYGELPTATKSRHGFLGWYTKASGGTEVTAESVVTMAAKRTLYAHWTDQQVTTFSGNGGSPATQVTTNTIAEKYGELPTARQTGYALVGWFTEAEGGSQVTANTTVTTAAERTLYAHWTDQQVTVFKGNGGSPSWQAVTNIIATKYGAFPDVSWTNHVFQGWFDAADGGERVTVNSTVNPEMKRTLYAHWTDQQVATFRWNDGTTNATTKTYVMGKAYGTMPTPKRTGYAFLGWFTASNGGDEVKATAKATVSTKRTLYAHWTDQQVTTFSGNGGSPVSQVTTNTFAGKYGELPTARRTGYALVGWFTAAEGGAKVTTNTTVTTAAERTLYAHWTDQQVTTFKGNGGSPSSQVVTNTIATKYGAFPEVSWSNHVFQGWFDAADGGERVTVNSTVSPAMKRTLYAHWTDQQVATFRWNDGTTNATTKTYVMGKAYGTMPTPKRSGYVFLGWFTASNGGDEVKATDKATVSTKRTLYAHWTDQQVTTFSGNGGAPQSQVVTNIIAAKYGELPTARRTGYGLIGWFTEPEGGTQVTANTTVTTVPERTLYAHWTDQQVTTFKGNGGTPSTQKTTNTISAKYGSFPAVTWANHVFQGWYTAAADGDRITVNSTVSQAAKRTLYAHWTDQQVTTFRRNDGTANTVAVATNTMGAAYGQLPTPKWTGHAFLGWFTAAEGGTQVTADTTVTVATKRTLYAHWTDQQVTTFSGNGGAPKSQVVTNMIGAKYGELPTARRTGYGLIGWFTEPEGGTQVTANTTVTTAAERTLYAHWTDQQVTTFKGNGGTPSTQKTTNTISAKYGSFPAVSWSNHVFQGWYTAAEDGDRITVNSTVSQAAKRTLYAHWTDQQVTTFSRNDGTTAIVAETTNTMGQAYGTLPAPKWTGYAFLGWFTAASGGTEVTGTDLATAATKRTLYAHWTDQQTLMLDPQGGTVDPTTITATIGQKYGTLPKPTWSGHVFLGWFTEAVDGVQRTANSTVTTAAERTFYAHWREGTKSLSIKSASMAQRSATARAAGRDNAPETLVLRFEAEAGCTYEVQWTASLGGEWETILSWTAEEYGEAELELPLRAGESGAGFYRIASDE